MRGLRGLCAVAVLGLLTACGQPPEFRTALSEPGTAEYDPRILGQWYDPKDKGIFIKIWKTWGGGKNRHNLGISAVAVGRKGGGGMSFEAHASAIDGDLYYNVKRKQTAGGLDYTAPEEKPGYIILRVFHLTPDVMLVCGLLALPKGGGPKSWRKWYSQVLAGSGLTADFAEVAPRLNGNRLSENQPDKMLHTLVEGSREDLIDFVTANPAEHFRGMLVLARFGTTDPVAHDRAMMRTLIDDRADRCNVRRGLR
ncbi:MAG: hypothetical protein R3229_04440 [Alphaproteobacteria bacterium]|nr:hypothetical protein [Alphaproteobacteria bacterium]